MYRILEKEKRKKKTNKLNPGKGEKIQRFKSWKRRKDRMY